MKHFKPYFIILLLFVANACTETVDHLSFLRQRGIEDAENVPKNYDQWPKLAGDYTYYIDVLNKHTKPQLTIVIADKKEKKMVSLCNLNPNTLVATIAPKVTPQTIVLNYRELSLKDMAQLNDMNGINKMLKGIPELKNFSWKNELQNKIMSSIIQLTDFNYVYIKNTDSELTDYTAFYKNSTKDKTLNDILKSNISINRRLPERLNELVEMSQYIDKLGFYSENENHSQIIKEKIYIKYLTKDNPINLNAKGKVFFFYPFKSFKRPASEQEKIIYFPAIHTFEYSFVLDTDGFPLFKKETRFIPLL